MTSNPRGTYSEHTSSVLVGLVCRNGHPLATVRADRGGWAVSANAAWGREPSDCQHPPEDAGHCRACRVAGVTACDITADHQHIGYTCAACVRFGLKSESASGRFSITPLIWLLAALRVYGPHVVRDVTASAAGLGSAELAAIPQGDPNQERRRTTYRAYARPR